MTNSTYTPSVHLFVDMDGTLVTWKQAACFEELLQENYFRDLPPLTALSMRLEMGLALA